MITRDEARARLLESVEQLVRAFDGVLDEAFGSDGEEQDPGAVIVEGDRSAIQISPGENFDDWRTYQWPDGNTERYSSARSYRVVFEGTSRRVVVARTERPAWGEENRGRAVVFGQERPPGTQFYPWVEFVRTDKPGAAGDHLYAATIPDPERPRAVLREGKPVPEHLEGADVRRADALFDSIREGPSLRLAVEASDEAAMVRHACWVAKLRGR